MQHISKPLSLSLCVAPKMGSIYKFSFQQGFAVITNGLILYNLANRPLCVFNIDIFLWPLICHILPNFSNLCFAISFFVHIIYVLVFLLVYRSRRLTSCFFWSLQSDLWDCAFHQNIKVLDYLLGSECFTLVVVACNLLSSPFKVFFSLKYLHYYFMLPPLNILGWVSCTFYSITFTCVVILQVIFVHNIWLVFSKTRCNVQWQENPKLQVICPYQSFKIVFSKMCHRNVSYSFKHISTCVIRCGHLY